MKAIEMKRTRPLPGRCVRISGAGVAAAALAIALFTMSLTGCDGFFSDPILTSISVTPATPSVAVAGTQQMTATGVYDDQSTKTLTTGVTWSSSDPSIATVSAAGVVTGVAAGTATVTATVTAASSTISGSTSVTVTTSKLASIAITPTSALIASGQNQTFTATGTFEDGSTSDLTNSVVWNSSDPNVATISSSGTATAQAVTSIATTNITATSGGVTSNVAVLTVSP